MSSQWWHLLGVSFCSVEIFLVLGIMSTFLLNLDVFILCFILWDWILFKPSIFASILQYCSGPFTVKWRQKSSFSTQQPLIPKGGELLLWLAVPVSHVVSTDVTVLVTWLPFGHGESTDFLRGFLWHYPSAVKDTAGWGKKFRILMCSPLTSQRVSS